MDSFVLTFKQLESYCPFYFVVDECWRYRQIGPSMQKVIAKDRGQALFNDNFEITSILVDGVDELLEEVFVVRHRQSRAMFKGRVYRSEFPGTGLSYIFLINPMVREQKEMMQLGLTFADFAPQDPIFDYLMLIHSLRLSHQDALRLKEAAELASRAKSAFVANMSHEIRTPLNAIIGYIDILNDEISTDRHREMLSTVRSSGKHLLGIINDILDFSKIESGMMVLEQSSFNLVELLKDVVTLFQVEFQKKGLYLRLEVADGLHPYVSSDALRLRQILINLVSNAYKFTSLGGVRIGVRDEPLDPDKSRYHLVVADTGVGIPDGKLKSIFEAFEQGDSSITRQYGGTGLGLSINRRLIQLMDGDITVRSRVGFGSEFQFHIELQTATMDSCHDKSIHKATMYEGFRKDLRVLVAEDNDVNQKLMHIILKKLGYHPAFANNGEEAITASLAQPFDLILMDLQMPVMDGILACKSIRRETTQLQPFIVALTANSSVEERDQCRQAGMDDFIAKPIELEALCAMLARLFPLHEPPPRHQWPQPIPLKDAQDDVDRDIASCAAHSNNLQSRQPIERQLQEIIRKLQADMRRRDLLNLTRHAKECQAVFSFLHMASSAQEVDRLRKLCELQDWNGCEALISMLEQRVSEIIHRWPKAS